MGKRGMTLLEVMVSVTVLTLVMGTMYTLARTVGEAARVQEAKITTTDDTRMGMQLIVRDLRQASAATVFANAFPAAAVNYRMARDVDGNGYAVDVGGFLELSPPRTVVRDVNDLNGDGQRGTQLLIWEATNGRGIVLTNNLAVNEDTNGNGVLDAGEDTNNNGQLERGFWVERSGAGIRVTIETLRAAPNPGQVIVTRLQETVVPRN